MLLKDLIEIYRVYAIHILEILERFSVLNKADAQKAFVMYQNYINLSEAIKNKANKLVYMFNFPITLPDFTAPEEGQVEVLKLLVQNAEENNVSDTQNVARNLKANMKKVDLEKGAVD